MGLERIGPGIGRATLPGSRSSFLLPAFLFYAAVVRGEHSGQYLARVSLLLNAGTHIRVCSHVAQLPIRFAGGLILRCAKPACSLKVHHPDIGFGGVQSEDDQATISRKPKLPGDRMRSNREDFMHLF
jgi:hypothetical protein